MVSALAGGSSRPLKNWSDLRQKAEGKILELLEK
jgi:hypothetical protein